MRHKKALTPSARKRQRAATPPIEGTTVPHSPPPEGSGVGSWHLQFTLNGKRVSKRVKPTQTLLDCLRLEFGLTGTKGACLEGECGSCYVLVNGRPMNSCMMLAPQVHGREVLTIEGLAKGKPSRRDAEGRGQQKLDVIQDKFIECGAVQCGYCTPGLIMAAKALLNDNPHPTRQEFLVGMEGNICRCTGYNRIMRACELAADELSLPRGRGIPAPTSRDKAESARRRGAKAANVAPTRGMK